MKKLILIGLLILISACQTATPTPEPASLPTATVPASPTPIPATSTPEPTPTFEPSPTPLPRYFTTQFDSSLAGWSVLQAGNEAVPNIAIENSALRMQMDNPYVWLYALYGAQDYADIYIETEYVNSALSPASAGLVCRYDETEGWLEYNVLTDGTYNVLYGKWLDAGIAEYLPVIEGSSSDIKASGDVQQIAMTCAGATVYLHLNGIVIRSVDVSRFELGEGKVGVTASSFEYTPVIAAFDYVTISEP
ncbi:MAG: hypothetical protein HXY42_08635 [Chloroflexi bacterium]|nr:hypothetical protein [Chloroflexota bacterium]